MDVLAAVQGHVVRIAGWRRMFRAVMLSAVALCAQSGNWAQVRALAPGSQVEVKRFSGGGEVRGVVENVSDAAVVVQRESDSVTVDRSDVRRVRLRSNEKTKSGRITGVVILGGLGVLGSSISDTGSAGSRAAGMAISGGIGYLIGWAVDGPKRIVIYKVQ